MAVAAYVTTQAPLKLYEELRELEDSVLYCDTDSVIFIRNVHEPPNMRIGNYIVHLIDELEVLAPYLLSNNLCRLDH